jgi:hypothetical protein
MVIASAHRRRTIRLADHSEIDALAKRGVIGSFARLVATGRHGTDRGARTTLVDDGASGEPHRGRPISRHLRANRVG